MRLVFFGVLFAVTSAARAQSLAVSVMDVQGTSDASVRKVHRAAVEQLGALAAAKVSESYDWKGPKRGCADTDLGCQRDKVNAQRAAAVIALWIAPGRLTGVLWLDGERVPPTRDVELSADALDASTRTLLEGLVPAWMKKGWGGLKLSEAPPPGSVLKVDGRAVSVGPKSSVIPVTAGTHQLDLLLPDGRGVLQRLDVEEGSRTRVDVAPPAPVGGSGGSASGVSALRLVSYAAWMVGAATLMSAFIVGFVGRQTAVGQSPCTPQTRECVTIGEAMEKQRQAAGYAFTANVLLVTGLVFSVAGAGLFTFDLL